MVGYIDHDLDYVILNPMQTLLYHLLCSSPHSKRAFMIRGLHPTHKFIFIYVNIPSYPSDITIYIDYFPLNPILSH